jgi:predicted enzyme related to lactoylglutathione lyase
MAVGSVGQIHISVTDLDRAVTFYRDVPPHVVHRDGGMELWMADFCDPDAHNLVLMQERPCPS